MSFYSSADVKNELLEPSVHVPTDRSEFRIHGDVLTSLKLVNNAPFGDATSVLNDFAFGANNRYYSHNDVAEIKTLGVKDNTFKGRGWFYNVASQYNVKNIEFQIF